MKLTRANISDIIHAIVVVIVCVMATIYAATTHDHSNNVWIVYGAAIAFAAGRAGAAVATNLLGGDRINDPPPPAP